MLDALDYPLVIAHKVSHQEVSFDIIKYLCKSLQFWFSLCQNQRMYSTKIEFTIFCPQWNTFHKHEYIPNSTHCDYKWSIFQNGCSC